MSANAVDDQSHIISKGSYASLASPRNIVEFPEEDVHNQDKEKRGEWATLADATHHAEAFKCGPANLDEAFAIMVECFRHVNHLQGEGEAVEHVHEEVLRNAGEGGLEVEEYNCPFRAVK